MSVGDFDDDEDDTLAVEGEDEEEEDGEDSKAGDDEFLQACLPVGGAPMPPSDEPPKDANEYLRQVQWERMHCPDVVDVEVEDKPRRRKKRGLVGQDGGLLASFGIIELPPEAQPPPLWTEDAVAAFSALRERCQELRREVDGHQRVTFDGWRERCAKGRPSTQVLSQQDFVSINHLVVVIVELFATAQEAAENAATEAQTVDAEDPFSAADGVLAEWAFAMLLFVEQPLFDDTQYQLQRLRRACQKALVASVEQGDGGASDRRSRAALLLTIVQDVFGQR